MPGRPSGSRPGRALAGPAYWEARRTGDPSVFYGALETCGRAGARGDAVGSTVGVAAARRDLARDQIAGRAAPDAELDPGICHDVYLVLGDASAEGAAVDDGRLTADVAAFVTAQARGVRERAQIDGMGGRTYSAPPR